MVKLPIFAAGLLAFAPLLTQAAPTPFRQIKRDLKYAYGPDKVRGVNLGGWFVLEPWITPNLFEPYAVEGGTVFDEYTLCETLGKDAALSILQNHWNTWITEDDFVQIAAAGLNHVRIPVGYWSVAPVEGDPYVQGAYEVLGRALGWAETHGLSVWIDLHGAPGSQNGFDNSGRKGAIAWTQGATIEQTHAALNKIRDDHATHPAVVGIELINEPMGPTLNMDTIRQFYFDGWGNLDTSPVAVVMHDAFQDISTWNDFAPGLERIILDTHHYEVFNGGVLGLSPAGHIGSACAYGRAMAAVNKKWVVAGEWAGASTDCAKWLNGLGVGARYDGTYPGSSYIGDCAGFASGTVEALSDEKKDNIGRFIEAQLDAYEMAAGWVFWTWKTQGAPEWDMQALLAAGIFPQPLEARRFPGQCG